MWYRGKTKSHAIRIALAGLGPDADHHEVVRRLAKRRVSVQPNHVLKIKARLLEKSFWRPDVQRGLKRAQRFIAEMGSVERARAALHLAEWIDES